MLRTGNRHVPLVVMWATWCEREMLVAVQIHWCLWFHLLL